VNFHEKRILTEIAAPRNLPMALVAVTSPLPEDPLPPKRGGGYVELGDHVVVCSVCDDVVVLGLADGLADGLDVTTCLAVLSGLFVVAGRVVVEIPVSGIRPRL